MICYAEISILTFNVVFLKRSEDMKKLSFALLFGMLSIQNVGAVAPPEEGDFFYPAHPVNVSNTAFSATLPTGNDFSYSLEEIPETQITEKETLPAGFAIKVRYEGSKGFNFGGGIVNQEQADNGEPKNPALNFDLNMAEIGKFSTDQKTLRARGARLFDLKAFKGGKNGEVWADLLFELDISHKGDRSILAQFKMTSLAGGSAREKELDQRVTLPDGQGVVKVSSLDSLRLFNGKNDKIEAYSRSGSTAYFNVYDAPGPIQIDFTDLLK